MKYSYLVLVVAVIVATAAWAQGPDTLWTQVYGGASDDWGYDIIEVAGGNYVIAGSTRSYGTNATTGNAYILKVDDNGDTVWTKIYGDTGGEDVDAVVQTTDGGYALVGYTSSSGAGGADFFLLKLNGSGDFEWSRTYGGANNDEARGIRQTSDGGYVICGYTRSFGPGIPGFDNSYIVKTNSAGDTLWTRTYGGTNSETAFAIEQLIDGNYVVAGHTGSYGSGSTDAWLLKLDANGDTLWTRTYGGIGQDAVTSLAKTADGGYVLGGSSASFTPGVNDVYLIKVDAAGNEEWSEHYGGTNSDQGYSVRTTWDGGYILGGITKSYGPGIPANNNYYLIKTDADGDTLWTRVYGGSNNEVANAVRQVSDGGYITVGYTRSFGPGVPNANIYLIRLETETPLSTPANLVTLAQGDSLILWWDGDDNPFYRVYSDTNPEGLFETLEGSTSDTTFVITSLSTLKTFYRVTGSVAP